MSRPSQYRNNRWLKCELCNGSGFKSGDTCKTCGGSGRLSPTEWAKAFARGEVGKGEDD